MARHKRRTRADEARLVRLVEALRFMNFAFNNVRLYPPTHAEVVGVMARLQETLAGVFEEAEDVGYGFMDELLYIEGAMSVEETAANQMLVDRFSRCRVKYLTIMKGVTPEDLLAFFQLLNAEATKPSAEHPAELLEKMGVRTIHIVEADVDDVASKSKVSRKKTLFDWYVKAVGVLDALRAEFMAGGDPDLRPLFHLTDDMMATIRNKGFEPFLLLPRLSRGLDAWNAHSVNVAVLACALGEACGLNSGHVQTLCVTAFLHDLGRLIIPPEWADDPSPLSAADREVVRQHADWSYFLLTKHPELSPGIGLFGALHHRADLPAGGYQPDVIHRILAVADHYDLAYLGDKYYWRHHRPDRVLRHLLLRRGRPHEPALLKLLVNAVGYYPTGTLVRLDDGQRAVVVRPNPMHPARPRVWLFESAAPAPAEGEAESSLPLADLTDLAAGGLGFARSIAGVLPPDPATDVAALIDAQKEYLLSFNL
ncbi:MAG: HD domain-containing protein [Elusimicrobia bacterium]|nr:HD domain-containing protein [Elusimicrobiota bacterium]